MVNNELWRKCADFHGHECPGLTLGYRAALYACELLGIEPAPDLDLAVISENDFCCVDAFQVLLGCTVGKGNLYIRNTGKIAFSVFDKATGKSVRLVQKQVGKGLDKKAKFELFHALPADEIFAVTDIKCELPPKGKKSKPVVCSVCGEEANENMMVFYDGKAYCRDCAPFTVQKLSL